MASGKIKGITIEIGGDTTKLGKALDGSEKKTRSLQGELRQIEKLLKFDPSNVELLTQKQSTLAEMVESTSEKLKTLKEAEAQVVAQFERGEIAEDQVRALQREIIQTENNLNDVTNELQNATRNLEEFGDNNGVAQEEAERLNRELEEQNEELENERIALALVEQAQREHEQAVEDARAELDQFGESVSGAMDKVKTGMLALGGATIAGATYAVKLSDEFDKALNILMTKTGASKDEMEALDEAMTNVYSNNFGESIQDVAESMAIVKTNTNLAGKELESITEYAILMRDTFDFEVNESIRAVNSLMDQFGVTAEEAYNLIAQGAQNGLNQNDDLMDIVNEYSIQFKNAGYSAEDMFNMLKNGAETGTWSVDKLGDALKEFNIRASDGTVSEALINNAEIFGLTTKEAEALSKEVETGNVGAYQSLLDKLKEVDDDAKRYQLGVAMYGTMWEDLGEETVFALMNTQGEISKTADALNTINEMRYDDIGSALQGLGRTLQTDLVEPIGDELKPYIVDVIEYVQENSPQIKEILSNIVQKVGEFVGFIVNNGSEIISVIAGITAGLIAWNVGNMIMTVVSAIKAFQLANEGATVAQALLNVVMNANPIMLIVTAIIAVVTALVTFIATNEDARNKIVEIWNKIKEVAGTVFGVLVTFFTETVPNAIMSFKDIAVSVFTNIVDFVKNNWQSLLLLIINPFAGAFALAYEHCEGFRAFVDNFVLTIKNFFINMGTSIVNFFTSTIPTFIENMGSWFMQLPEKIGYALGYIIGKLILWSQNVISWITTNVPLIIQSVVKFFSELPGKIWVFLVNIVTKIATWCTNMKKKATEGVTELIKKVVDFFKQLPGKIYDAIKGAVDKIATWGSNMKSKAVSMISNMISSVVTTAKGLPQKVYDAIKGAIDKISTWGTNMKNKAKTAITNVATTITDGLKNLPTSVETVGKNIVEGLWRGIQGAKDWIKQKVGEFAKGILQGMKDALGIKSPSRVFRDQVGKYIAEGIGVGITANEDSAINALEQVGDDMVNSAKGINGLTLNRQLETTFKGSIGNGGSISDLVDLVSEYMPKIIEASNKAIMLDTGVLVGETIDHIDRKLANNYALKARGI